MRAEPPALVGRASRAAEAIGRQLLARWTLHGDVGLPTQIHVCPTDRCNLKCRQCDIWRIKPAPELTTEEWKHILAEISAWAGPVSLNFAGGEPFLRPDLVELIAFAVDQGFTVTSNTNGTLIDAAMARRLYEAGLDVLYVSLDGFTAATHDHIRNKAGLFDTLMRHLDHLDALPGPRVILATILHRRSVHEVELGLDLVRRRGYQLVVQPLYQTFGEPFDPEWYRRSALFPDDLVAVDQALDTLIAVKRADGPVCNPVEQLHAMKGYYRAPTLPNGKSCKAGFGDLSLDPYGNFHLCYHLRPLGDVRRHGVRALWESKESAVLRQEVASCPRTCNLLNCNFGAEGGVGAR